jgi:hypothetical protein
MQRLPLHRSFFSGIFETGLSPLAKKSIVEPLVSEGWKVTTDIDIRGSSRATLENNTEGGEGGLRWRGHTSLDLDQNSKAVKTGELGCLECCVGSSRFTLRLLLLFLLSPPQTLLPPPTLLLPPIFHPGFVSITSPPLGGMLTPYLDLDDYETLMLTLRKRDNRNYIVNLHPDSYINGEIYQGYIMDDREEEDVLALGDNVEEITVKVG